ncbi:sensor histidine kinase [Xanthocytophaga flava]|uniref:sensor histidine kinase n=1 Tax=Xanthocytophaga flava TaxID=3048013 RepID=UPI0028D791F1|nr:histidine kinase [Xanthocytophaga flavus]MDJ1472808.1 histidine kinase [Xanthocytophaga flavus]
MNHLLKKQISWILITGTLFTCFYWLFRLAIPGAAFEFATSITAIIMSGLLSGRYVARLGYNTSPHTSNLVLVVLIGLVIIGLMGMGWLISKMIGNTQFHHFFFTILLLFLVNGLVAAIISLVRNRIKTTLRLTQTALAQSKTELQLLQSQMSPHFLFNTLNNLYGLSLSEHYKVPELLLKLSDLLRYSVYEAKEIFVPLQDEVNYLKNYIEFEKIRLGDRLSLTLQLQEVNDKSVHIAPLLWIVFVENAKLFSKRKGFPKKSEF